MNLSTLFPATCLADSTYYLAQKLVFGQVLFSSACVCVCLSVYIDYLKKFLTDFDETWQDGEK